MCLNLIDLQFPFAWFSNVTFPKIKEDKSTKVSWTDVEE